MTTEFGTVHCGQEPLLCNIANMLGCTLLLKIHSQRSIGKAWSGLTSLHALQGVNPLLADLTAFTPGMSGINTDNSFCAGLLAARILRIFEIEAKPRAQASTV